MEQENRPSLEVNNLANDVVPANPEPPIPINNLTPNQAIKTPKGGSRWIFIVLVLVLLSIVGGGVWYLSRDNKPTENNNTQNENVITNFDECVAAGYSVMESFPEKCSVPGGQTFVNTKAVDDSPPAEEAVDSTPKCADDETLFADKEFGAAFCYPSEWGTASVMDAKIDTSDTGYREAVRFSANTKFIVGGTSEDWSTTIGRGVGCQEPNNVVPELSSYDTNWHDFSGEGMAIEFATRSVISAEGGYDITETVSNMLDVGVCVQGHKVINGSRYKVLSEAYFTDFSSSAGITTPKAHIDNSNILFTETERIQFDSLLASAISY